MCYIFYDFLFQMMMMKRREIVEKGVKRGAQRFPGVR